jgi:hypothetical protein
MKDQSVNGRNRREDANWVNPTEDRPSDHVYSGSTLYILHLQDTPCKSLPVIISISMPVLG